MVACSRIWWILGAEKNTELTMRAFAQSKAFGTLIVRAQLDDCAYSSDVSF